jgi:Mlc titration factor MtfA (ptsG expression regulator)
MLKAVRDWRRRRILARAAFDEQQWRAVARRFAFVEVLGEEEQAKLRDWVVLFLHDKSFSAAAGLMLTDEMQLTIATQACILILGLDLDYYRGWSEIIVYPAQFVPRHQYTDEAGVVHETAHPHMGEAWLHGPVVLSWDDVAANDMPEGMNVVIHEFAHKLDMLNGDANGFPPLHADMSRREWAQTFRSAYEDFCARVDAQENTIIDPYASESPGEFFAVLSEVFFELPGVLRDEYPAVYAQLRRFYRQDPVARLGRPLEAAGVAVSWSTVARGSHG